MFGPIGTFHCLAEFPYDVPRQPSLAGDNCGVIRLLPGHHFEQALTGLETFDRIWLLFLFHKNDTWHPMVQPPRHLKRKIGLFACRAPYRPNPIGLSCVKLVSIKGLEIHVAGHDLLDQTPILDIKPYLPYADAFPDASPGWTCTQEESVKIQISPKAEQRLAWLEANGVPCIRAFLKDRLCAEPLNPRRNRLYGVTEASATLAYRTWRMPFLWRESVNTVTVTTVFSGYTPQELHDAADPYQDKAIHRQFRMLFS